MLWVIFPSLGMNSTLTSLHSLGIHCSRLLVKVKTSHSRMIGKDFCSSAGMIPLGPGDI